MAQGGADEGAGPRKRQRLGWPVACRAALAGGVPDTADFAAGRPSLASWGVSLDHWPRDADLHDVVLLFRESRVPARPRLSASGEADAAGGGGRLATSEASAAVAGAGAGGFGGGRYGEGDLAAGCSDEDLLE